MHLIAAASFFWAWALGFLYYQYRGSRPATAALFVVPQVLMYLNNEQGGPLTCVTLLATSAAIAFGGRARLSPRDRRFLLWLGNLSFPVYIAHVPVFVLLWGLGVRSPGAHFVAAYVVAAVLYYTVDRPLRVKTTTPMDGACPPGSTG